MYAELVQKRCSKCGETKVLDCFYADKRMRSGHSSWCKGCFKAAQKKYQQGPYRERKNELCARYRATHPDRVKTTIARWMATNREKHREACKNWMRRNAEEFARYSRSWRLQNLDHVRAKDRRNKAQRRRASPPWLTEEQLNLIRNIYESCPSGSHVDHIVPLNGTNVSGLHVPWNLQHLPAHVNRAKYNKY